MEPTWRKTKTTASLFFGIIVWAMFSKAHAQSHPHLFFNQAGMDAVQSRVLNNSRLNKIWQKYKIDRVDVSYQVNIPNGGGINSEDEGRDYGDALADMGMAYIVLRDQKYVSKAIDMMKRLASKTDWGNDLSIAHISMGFALCWDVMYSQISSGDKTTIRNVILSRADNDPNNDVYTNHNWTPSAGEGLVGLSFQGDGDSAFNNFVSGLLQDAKTNFKETDRNVLWAHGTDGFPHQGLGYWRKYTHIGSFLTALRYNQPQNDWFNLGKQYPGCEFLKNTAYPRIYADVQHPDLATITWADSRQVAGEYGHMATLTFVASEYDDGEVFDFIDYVINEADYRFNGEDWATFLFYDDTNAPVKNFRDLPLSRYWPDMEAAIFRGGWDDHSMVFYMRCGSPGGHGRRLKNLPAGGHDHPDANGYVLFYNNDYLAAEDGASPLLGPDEGTNEFTYGHNTFLIDGLGQRGDGTTSVATTSANMDYLDAEHVGYLLGNATDAYSGIDRLYRYVIYKKHKYIIIVDEINDNSSHKYEFLLGTDSHHTITSNGQNKFTINPQGGSAARLPIVFVEPQQISSSINDDRAYAMDSSMVEMLRVWPKTNSTSAKFFTLQYPRKNGDPDPTYTKIYEGSRSGIVVDGDEYYLYNDGGATYSYGNINTDAKLCYYKNDDAAFEYLVAGCSDFRYKNDRGMSSDKDLVAAFKGANGKIRIGKTLGPETTASVTLRYPGINGVIIDGQVKSLTSSGPGWVRFTLAPKQYKIGPTGSEQTVTDNYDVLILGVEDVQLTSPNGGENWTVGSEQSIAWSSQGQIANVRLDYSIDRGATWTTITSGISNDGNYAWMVPDAVSSSCLIRVADAADGSPSDASNNAFSIVAPPSLTLVSPNGGESWLAGSNQNITWNPAASIAEVKLEFSADAGVNWATITSSTANDGAFAWTTPQQASSQCLLRISESISGNPSDASDAVFSLVAPPPQITSFTPSSGPVGTEVTINGDHFSNTISVLLNDVAASFIVDTDIKIRATVPPGATSGRIKVTTSAGAATSAADFTVTSSSPITTLNFLPTHDAYVKSSSATSNYGSGTTLRARKSSSETLYSYLKFELTGLSGLVVSAKLKFYVVDASTDGGALYAVSDNYKGTTNPWVESGLTWNNAPEINGMPISSVGSVTVATWVEFDLTNHISGDGIYSLGLKSEVSNALHYGSSEGANKPQLTIQLQSGQQSPPTISTFAPASGPVGTEVIITGANFSGVSSVKFNGAAAATFVVDSQTQIRATVPSGASSGQISVTTGAGTAMSATNFTVTAPGPAITSFTPASGPVGTEVTITGNNFNGVSSVQFNGAPATTFVVDLETQVRATVPAGATSGKISVATGAGTALSATDFTVTVSGVTTTSFTPSADTYVKKSSSGTNYGGNSDLRVRLTSSDVLNTYLKFEINGLSGAVQNAKLRLYAYDASNDGGALYSVSNNYANSSTGWTESGLTWSNAPSISGAALAIAGAVSAGSWVEFEVTAIIAGNGTYSVGLKNNSSDLVVYTSRSTSNKPELIVQTATASIAARDHAEKINEAPAVPREFALHQNYPNPFNPETRIDYDVPVATQVQVTIHDALGREVAVLIEEQQPPGNHHVVWNGREANGQRVSSGIYFYHLRAGGFRASRKMLLLQ